MSLGERIQQLRKAAGLSQEQLAEMVGVSRQAISKWETDQSTPEIEKIILLSKVFSITTDELLGNEFLGNNPPENMKISSMPLADVLQSNIQKRQFTIGWITVVFGLALLVFEFYSLIIIQSNAQRLDLEYAAGIGFYSNPMEYAHIEPMLVIFAVTVAIIACGIGLLIYSLIRKKKQSSYRK